MIEIGDFGAFFVMAREAHGSTSEFQPVGARMERRFVFGDVHP